MNKETPLTEEEKKLLLEALKTIKQISEEEKEAFIKVSRILNDEEE